MKPVLVDSSVWIDHFKKSDPLLCSLLDLGLVRGHPFVLGELACGNVRNRSNVLQRLEQLASLEEGWDSTQVRSFVETEKLHGLGLGWMDAVLLTSAVKTGCDIYTRDRSLGVQAKRLGVLFSSG